MSICYGWIRVHTDVRSGKIRNRMNEKASTDITGAIKSFLFCTLSLCLSVLFDVLKWNDNSWWCYASLVCYVIHCSKCRLFSWQTNASSATSQSIQQNILYYFFLSFIYYSHTQSIWWWNLRINIESETWTILTWSVSKTSAKISLVYKWNCNENDNEMWSMKKRQKRHYLIPFILISSESHSRHTK